MKIRYYLTLTILLTVLQAGAVDIFSRKLNSDNGLPDNNVRNISQDEKGFLWLGTPNGLYRYDGYFYTTYRYPINGDARFLNNIHITGTQWLSSGMMLIREQGNIFSLFDVTNDRFISLENDGKPVRYRWVAELDSTLWLWDESKGCMRVDINDSEQDYTSFCMKNGKLRSDRVLLVAADKEGVVWVCTDEGIYYIEGDNAVRAHSGKAAVSMVTDEAGSYIVTRDGFILQVVGKKLRPLLAPRNVESTIGRVIRAASLGSGRIVMVTTGTTMVYDMKIRSFVPSSDFQLPGGSIIYDNLGNPVLLDQTGLIWYVDRKSGEIIKIQVFDSNLVPLVSSRKYKVLAVEKSGQIWVSTNGCGITVYDRTTHTAQSIRHNGGLISSDYILDICLDKEENIWAADEFYGIVYLVASNNDIENILLDNSNIDTHRNQVNIMQWIHDSLLYITNTRGDIFRTDNLFELSQTPWKNGVDVHSISEGANGEVWIGTRQHGLWIGEEHYLRNYNDPTSLSSDAIWYVFKDHAGRMWVATEDAHLDLAVRKPDGTYFFQHYFNTDIGAKILNQDHRGVIWMGAKTGLYTFKPEELLKNRSAYKQVLNYDDLKNREVSCLFEDSKHRLWVGTIGNGIYCADNTKEKPEFELINTGSGLISNEVQSVIESTDGMIWIGTKKGITCYNPDTKTFRYLYDNNHLLRNYYMENSVCMLHDGRMAFGTNEGIVVYDADDWKTMTHNHPIVITDILINGISVSALGDDNPIKTAPDNINEIRLAHDQNSVTVRFSNFNYKTTTGTRYTYYLENYDKEWSELSPISFAAYKNLSPGKYTLHIKAYDNNSSQDVEKDLTIIIRHPWWSTWWAYIIYIVLILGLGYLIYRQLRAVYKLRRRISIEKEVTELKLVFFTNISHEFRTPLTIIRGSMDKIRQTTTIPAELRQPLSSMGKSVDRMLRLINQLLEFRKMQNGKLRLALEETDVVAFLRSIYENFLDIADSKRISYTFLPSHKSYMAYIDCSHVDKIFYNIVSNAFKYTPTKGSIDIKIDFNEEKHRMSIRVEDTGVGVPKEKQSELFERFMQSSYSNKSTGIGLHLTHELVAVHHGTIRYEENQPTGSIFTVELPTDKSVYKDEDFLAEGHQLLQQEEKSEPRMPEYREVVGEPLNDRTVLVVEDDSDVITYISDTLGKYFVIKKAMDGEEALKAIAKDKPSLVVSDVSMPVMDGFELAKNIRSNPQTQDLPIILLTALDSEDMRLKGEKYGIDAYITKPFDTRLLIATCRKLVEQRDKLRHVYANDDGNVKQALPEIIIEERDKQFLDVLNTKLYGGMSNPMLSVESLAESMGYRRTIFFKKVKALTGQTPADYIRTIRMNKAAEMLREETITVAEVAYKVGINDPHYFAKVFKAQFGISPKKYQMGEKNSATTGE